ncbi:hypothetical protein F9B74_09445 [Pelistega sp. NLN82]|uniref:Uncharacterized protein n=1 Tax=Pelistega ratti TaxID=2652177 RepID=A0A6L9Y824_9BURK|nr:hypothetical protein [Pelistega ratti]NEN76529.1 hypothetical protein [Pelistega ratti]
MAVIHAYGPSATVRWATQGFNVFFKRFIPFTLLFITIFMLNLLSASIPFISLIVGIICLPLLQMVIFNAAYGVKLRGYFTQQDLLQKLREKSIWSKLILASLINIILTNIILIITLPPLPVPIETLMNISNEEIVVLMASYITFSNFLPVILGVCIYFLLTSWVYPLITWENLTVLEAFKQSLKATASNAIALSFLIIFYFALISISIILITQFFPSLSRIGILFVLIEVSAISAYFYNCLFAAYMEIFYGKQTINT